MTRHENAPQRRSGWIPWVFVGGMLLVIAVNGALVVFALNSYSGVAIDSSYERGRDYQAMLDSAARQDALGWTADLRVAEDALLVAVHDRAGAGVAGTVAGALLRPAGKEAVAVAPVPVAQGQWAIALAGVPHGQWDAQLTLTAADGTLYDIRRRVLLP